MANTEEIRGLTEIDVPDSLNYIGVFLFMGCNLGCSYCINDPNQADCRKQLFPMHDAYLSPAEFAAGLNRIRAGDDLPITLQGGEPSLYGSSKGLGELLGLLNHHVDLLTNLVVKPETLGENIAPHKDRLTRDAPYPSIRVSYHPDEMKRVWGEDAPKELVRRCQKLADYGFAVSPVKKDSDVGIYLVDYPGFDAAEEMAKAAEGKVPFETKEFLGTHDGKLYGSYLYPFSTDLYARFEDQQPVSCECRTTEMLIDPMGFVWRCHFYLYDAWSGEALLAPYQRLREHNFELTKHFEDIFDDPAHAPVAHILDPELSMDQVFRFLPCDNYGRCIGCDTKVKNNRHQSLDDFNVAHTSVMIRNLDLPDHLLDKVEDRSRIEGFLKHD